MDISLTKIAVLLRACLNVDLIFWLRNSNPMSSYRSIVQGSKSDRSVLKRTKEIILTLDKNRFSRIIEKYKSFDPYPGSSKYLDAPAHIARALTEAKMLGLDRTQELRILDIGSGAGYFPFVCNHLGHDTQAIDLDKNPIYKTTKLFLNISWTDHKIEPYKPLPKFSHKFDLITGFQIKFDKFGGIFWSEKEWYFFFNDIVSRILAPRGKLFIGLNTVKMGSELTRKLNLKYFKSMGADISRDSAISFDFSRVSLTKPGCVHPS